MAAFGRFARLRESSREGEVRAEAAMRSGREIASPPEADLRRLLGFKHTPKSQRRFSSLD
jgi:hypothetical protein